MAEYRKSLTYILIMHSTGKYTISIELWVRVTWLTRLIRGCYFIAHLENKIFADDINVKINLSLNFKTYTVNW